MKICHVNLARTYRGGERQTEMLIKNLSERGIEQRLVVRKASPLKDRLKVVEGLDIVEIGVPLFLYASACKGVDVVHAHEARAAHLALWNNWFSKVPYVITRRVPNSPGNDILTKRVYGRAAVVVALSQAIRSVILQYDPELDVRIIPSTVSKLPVDKVEVDRLRKKYAGKFIAGHIGALQKRHKGQQYLIQAARDLAKSFPDIYFLLAGEGEDEEVLKAQAEGLENVHFLGFRENVGDFLSVFDVFVFPSLKEGLGSILLDAMEFGKAVIASNVDGIRDIVSHDHNGLLVPVADAEALRDAVVALYQNKEQRKRLGDNGREFVRAYSPDSNAQAYMKLYREIVEGRNTQGT